MFKFELGRTVRLMKTDEEGDVIGRAEYSNGAPPSYLIRYRSADGNQVEVWWTEDAIA